MAMAMAIHSYEWYQGTGDDFGTYLRYLPTQHKYNAWITRLERVR